MKTDSKHEQRQGEKRGQPQPQQRPDRGQPGQALPGKGGQQAPKPAPSWPGDPGQGR